ncbi:hypothetical protein NB636_09545 [Oxalobacter aliiformigenes]|uniref:hypothetical protein n=1 Tax=Oxalobacter aliiformigenes TaxID=2946593 RepID=UPI0022AFA8A3|nr:hypothetical protein [Oxalobacter aliiformigenes]MCZ4064806.1 hypothetical protein [Oxalobacter aliiformigenes]WAV98922.1 hypothetical protein NB636_09545 [Oxalobacter aliiformigenes]
MVRLIHYRQTMKGLPAMNGNPLPEYRSLLRLSRRKAMLHRHTTRHDRNRFIHQGQTVFPNW